MAEFFDSIVIEIDFDAGSWTDVSSYVLANPSPQWRRGIMGNGPTDRVAGTGIFTFALKNTDGTFSPGHASVQSGFGIGNKVRLSFVFEGLTWYKFYGRISPGGIEVVPGTYGNRYTMITAWDWMGQINSHELRLLTMTLNKRADEALALIDANLEISPLVTDYNTGDTTLARVFHNVKERTRAIAETKKIVDSELGLYYVIGDRTGGETVVLDARYTRATTAAPLDLIKTVAESDLLLKEDGDYLLKEDEDNIVLSQVQAADFDNTMVNMDVTEGKHLANVIKSKAQQVTIDAAATTILFNLEKEIEIAGLTTETGLRSAYTDPSGAGRKVTGTEMVTPVANTDYTANAQADGGGADLTAFMTIVGADGLTALSSTNGFGAEAAEYGIKNTGTASFYVTKLQFRGKGMYDYQSVEYVAEDATSKALHGAISLTISFIYEPNPLVARSYGEVVLSETAESSTVVNYFEIEANRNSMMIYGFLQLEPGTRFSLDEDQTAIDADYFVNGYEATIHNRKFVKMKIIPRAVGFQNYWILGTSALGVDTGLAIG